MSTKQLNVRLPEVVIDDLNQLSKIYGSQAKALIAAIVNLKKEMKMSLSPKAQKLVLEIWKEQLAAGIGEPGEIADPERIDEWVWNRTYPHSLLEDAANGDVAAIAEVRNEAGLSILS